MSRKEWFAVVLVIGVGIVWQIPRHEDAMTGNEATHAHAAAEPRASKGEGASGPTSSPDAAGPYRTIVLEVTGMT